MEQDGHGREKGIESEILGLRACRAGGGRKTRRKSRRGRALGGGWG